jgi:hypothetical protein
MTMESWEVSIERARRANKAGFEAKMEVADASLVQVPENGAGAEGRTITDFADEADIAYSSLDKYRQVRTWLGDFASGGEIPNFKLAYVAKAHLTPAELVALLEEDPPDGHKRWTVAALEQWLEEREDPWPLFQRNMTQIHTQLRNAMDLAVTQQMKYAVKQDGRLREAIIGHCDEVITAAEKVKKQWTAASTTRKVKR